jgi:hypothetical protein
MMFGRLPRLNVNPENVAVIEIPEMLGNNKLTGCEVSIPPYPSDAIILMALGLLVLYDIK